MSRHCLVSYSAFVPFWSIWFDAKFTTVAAAVHLNSYRNLYYIIFLDSRRNNFSHSSHFQYCQIGQHFVFFSGQLGFWLQWVGYLMKFIDFAISGAYIWVFCVKVLCVILPSTSTSNALDAMLSVSLVWCWNPCASGWHTRRYCD